MEVFPASVVLIIRALVVSARWAGRSRWRALEQLTAAAETSRVAQLEARVAALEDTLELREAHIEVLESRLGQERPRKPYLLMERLRIIWLMEYFRIPGVAVTWAWNRPESHSWSASRACERMGVDWDRTGRPDVRVSGAQCACRLRFVRPRR